MQAKWKSLFARCLPMQSQGCEERLHRICRALVMTLSSSEGSSVSCDSGSNTLAERTAAGTDVESLQSALLALVQVMGPSDRNAAVGPLLQLLRAAGNVDFISDAAAAAIAVCCRASGSGDSATPLYRIFTFSPSLHVHIQEMEFSQAEVGWKVWGSAVVLAKRLIGMQEQLRGKSVLELGSGCGLCGLLTAKLGAGRVVLSDHNPHILQNLCSVVPLLPAKELSCSLLDPCNCVSPSGTDTSVGYDFLYGPKDTDIRINDRPSSQKRCRVEVRMLDWFEEAHEDALLTRSLGTETAPKLAADETFDFVIGSDLLYEDKSLQPLVTLLSHRLSRPNGRALIVTPIRKAYVLEFFGERLASAGLAIKVADIDSQEWDICCKASEEGTKARKCGEFQEPPGGEETFYGPDYYEGGCVGIFISR